MNTTLPDSARRRSRGWPGIFERIARAIPIASATDRGLPPHTLLNLYARLLEEAESVMLMTSHAPGPRPAVVAAAILTGRGLPALFFAFLCVTAPGGMGITADILLR